MLPQHRYAVGQRIQFIPGRFDGSAPSGAYTVLRQLPNDAADREYRVKNARDGHERIIRESQMRQGALA
ncbi:hypothetical protein [Falsiroseomonas sp.]|uniref:hypothetical protein n=1 Tax=Falsiroseomonas sp. TaxID=2870721 RepID=UPI003F708B13